MKPLKSQEELIELGQHSITNGKIIQERSLESVPPLAIALEKIEEGKPIEKYHIVIDRDGPKMFPIPPPSRFPIIFIPARHPATPEEIAERFGEMERNLMENVVLKALKIIEPRLQRLAVISIDEKSILHGNIGLPKLLPLSSMGDGMFRLSNLITTIGSCRNGMLLVDEIENGIHYSVLGSFWKAIGAAAKEFNTQVYATTHSFECIEDAHRAFLENDSYDCQFIRLEKIKDRITAVTYDKDTLATALDMNMEIR